RVTSPIGDLPFEVDTVRIEGRQLVVEGRLGAWQSRIHVEAADVPMLARALRVPLVAAATAGLAVYAVRRRG
ncbi:MAG TPA: hypothetical protein VJN72_01945, partial [Gaiellales bacterium]|nr:hypothetical protein [Gaiellales bacterium]